LGFRDFGQSQVDNALNVRVKGLAKVAFGAAPLSKTKSVGDQSQYGRLANAVVPRYQRKAISKLYVEVAKLAKWWLTERQRFDFYCH
jgi:hypothetical protein